MQAKLLDVCARARVCSSSIGSGGSGRRRDAVALPHVSIGPVNAKSRCAEYLWMQTESLMAPAPSSNQTRSLL